MNDETTVLDLRTPATSPLPVVKTPPASRARGKHKRRASDRHSALGEGIQVAAYLVLFGWLFKVAATGGLAYTGLVYR